MVHGGSRTKANNNQQTPADRSRSAADPNGEHGACGLGFVATRTGRPAPSILADAIRVLIRLDHRGAAGADPKTGDGCGVLLDIPDRLLRDEAATAGVQLPSAGQYAVAQLFLPASTKGPDLRREIEELALCHGMPTLWWRAVPVDPTACGPVGNANRPEVHQLILQAPAVEPDQIETACWLLRRELDLGTPAYACSLSARTIVYKGLLIPEHLADFYADLADPRTETRVAVVHQRFSTNTTPSWSRAQPLRLLAHNGEINTLKGNQRWMLAREAELSFGDFDQDPHLLRPILDTTASDSAQLDEALDLLVRSGRPVEQALAVLVPPAWRFGDRSAQTRAFHAWHETVFEPWDGPAGLAFCDGVVVGARLDRNGLRPLRFAIADDRVVCSSEAGALPLAPDRIERRGRLGPGESLLMVLADGEFLDGAQLQERIAGGDSWDLKRERAVRSLAQLPHLGPDAQLQSAPDPVAEVWGANTLRRLFGWTDEDVVRVVDPMAHAGKEAVGSMGDDTPPAVLSRQPQPLFRYFRQLFAQVTNPPIDSLRERSAMDLTVVAGARPRFLDGEGGSMVELARPILTTDELSRLQRGGDTDLPTATLSMHWDGDSLGAGLDRLTRAATEAIGEGAVLLILSDRGCDETRLPIPSLLATAAVHHHLVAAGLRTRADLIVDSGEPREVTDFCLLLAYGAAAVHPWLTLRTVADEDPAGVPRYLAAVHQGILKVMSKMGIATLQGYRGAQTFEALGLDRDFVRRYFRGTPSRLGGLDLRDIADEYKRRFALALAPRSPSAPPLPIAGRRRWTDQGEAHAWGPQTLHLLQHACRSGRFELFERFAARIDGQHEAGHSLRGLLRVQAEPIPLSEVESAASIVSRFRTGSMSYGSLGAEAHEALALAMNQLGAASNSGEGGEDPGRGTPDPDGRSRRSSIKQVASGRFGVTTTYLVSADELQIKIAQGAKPGEGGHLPGRKVDAVIAELRCSTPGVGLISPPPHHDIYSIEDLAQLIHDLRCVNPTASISVKLVSAVGVGTVAAGVAKAGADRILISGAGGGTGAAALTSIHHTGLPWELGLAETHQALVRHGLRAAVTLEVDGQLRTGRDVMMGALLGADSFGFATAALVALGCVMMRACHLNTCPVGIATQDPRLRERFAGHPDHVVNFFVFLAEHLRRELAAAGLRTLADARGRTDLLGVAAIDHPKAHTLDLGPLLHRAEPAPALSEVPPPTPMVVPWSPLESRLQRQAAPELLPVVVHARVTNTDRSIGTRLAGDLVRAGGIAPGAVKLDLEGSAGQSLGAFAPASLHIHLRGEANDYVGKGLSGGRIVIVPPTGRCDVLIGNVALYGATTGELFVAGAAGERFGVRNSGAVAVVEGVGDHGCEYMTGGRVLVLGPTGANFAAGMSGGIAWVLDEDGRFAERCNHDGIDIEPLDHAAAYEVRTLLDRHRDATGSQRAWRIANEWTAYRERFVQVMPQEYRRARSRLEVAHG